MGCARSKHSKEAVAEHGVVGGSPPKLDARMQKKSGARSGPTTTSTKAIFEHKPAKTTEQYLFQKASISDLVERKGIHPPAGGHMIEEWVAFNKTLAERWDRELDITLRVTQYPHARLIKWLSGFTGSVAELHTGFHCFQFPLAVVHQDDPTKDDPHGTIRVKKVQPPSTSTSKHLAISQRIELCYESSGKWPMKIEALKVMCLVKLHRLAPANRDCNDAPFPDEAPLIVREDTGTAVATTKQPGGRAEFRALAGALGVEYRKFDPNALRPDHFLTGRTFHRRHHAGRRGAAHRRPLHPAPARFGEVLEGPAWGLLPNDVVRADKGDPTRRAFWADAIQGYLIDRHLTGRQLKAKHPRAPWAAGRPAWAEGPYAAKLPSTPGDLFARDLCTPAQEALARARRRRGPLGPAAVRARRARLDRRFRPRLPHGWSPFFRRDLAAVAHLAPEALLSRRRAWRAEGGAIAEETVARGAHFTEFPSPRARRWAGGAPRLPGRLIQRLAAAYGDEDGGGPWMDKYLALHGDLVVAAEEDGSKNDATAGMGVIPGQGPAGSTKKKGRFGGKLARAGKGSAARSGGAAPPLPPPHAVAVPEEEGQGREEEGGRRAGQGGRSRTEFVDRVYARKAAIGNPNMSTRNVVLVTRVHFLSGGSLLKYEEVERRGWHVPATALPPGAHVLFVSHRWQDAYGNQPDSPDRLQYRVVQTFLETSPDGQRATHVWYDFGCINQERATTEGLTAFLQKLDNIPTAIFLSQTILVVPRIENASTWLAQKKAKEGEKKKKTKTMRDSKLVNEEQARADGIFSDLYEYTARGWCLMESMTGLFGGSVIYLGLVAGGADDLTPTAGGRGAGGGGGGGALLFARVDGGLLGAGGGAPVTAAALRAAAGERRGFAPAIARAARRARGGQGDRCPVAVRAAVENWRASTDPGAAEELVVRALKEGLVEWDPAKLQTTDMLQERAATLSVDVGGSSLGCKVAKLLPNFTVDTDREVVVRLLINVGTFVLTGFDKVQPRPEWAKSLVALHLERQALTNDGPRPAPAPLGGFLRMMSFKKAPQPPTPASSAAASAGAEGNGAAAGDGGGALMTLALPPSSGLLPCDLRSVLGRLAEQEEGARRASGAARAELRLGAQDNPVGPDAAVSVAALAAGCPWLQLTELNLTNCLLGAGGGVALAQWLGTPSAGALRHLMFEGNGLGDGGGTAVVRAVLAHPGLREARLARNDLRTGAARAVAEGAPANRRLAYLDLGGNERLLLAGPPPPPQRKGSRHPKFRKMKFKSSPPPELSQARELANLMFNAWVARPAGDDNDKMKTRASASTSMSAGRKSPLLPRRKKESLILGFPKGWKGYF